jgi:type IV fimbrial biogenesis protein FimT
MNIMALIRNNQSTEYRKAMNNQTEFSTGFTLIELIVTLSIAALLFGVAIPSFSSTITSSRLTATVNELVTALNFARSEAIKRGQKVIVRKTGENWEDGWQIFVDIDRSNLAKQNVFNTGTDIVLRVYSALPETYTLRGDNNFMDFIRFQPDGSANNLGSFVLCNNSDRNNKPETNTSKLVTVNFTGRVHIGIDADNDGIPEKDDGTEISSCTTGF